MSAPKILRGQKYLGRDERLPHLGDIAVLGEVRRRVHGLALAVVVSTSYVMLGVVTMSARSDFAPQTLGDNLKMEHAEESAAKAPAEHAGRLFFKRKRRVREAQAARATGAAA